MKKFICKILFAAGFTMSATAAFAACKAPFGTIANNDVLNFNGGITTSNTVFKRVYNQGPRKSGGTVTPSAECKAIIFPASGGHLGAKKGQPKNYSKDVRGIGCDCR